MAVAAKERDLAAKEKSLLDKLAKAEGIERTY
jgi:hypothetical protein